MKPQHSRSLAAALLAMTAAACGGAAREAPQAGPAPAADVHGTHTTAAATASATTFTGGHPWTEADARFMTHMIGHHAQAVQVAQLAPTHDASPAIRRLAARIIGAQEDEIATMQQ